MSALVAASIPNESTRYKKYLQEKLFEQIKGKELTAEDGFDKVKKWLEKELGEEALYKCESMERI